MFWGIKMNGDDIINMGLNLMNQGSDFEDVLSVRKCYSMAWGIFRHLENYQMMTFARESLESTGLDWDRLHDYQWKGYHIIKGKIENE